MQTDSSTFQLPPLYHGTDARMVLMSEKERQDYKALCSLAIEYLWLFFKPYNANFRSMEEMKSMLASSDTPNLFATVMDKISVVGGMKNGNPSYQYNHFYLTNMRERACRYAYRAFAGGEYGLIVHWLYTAAKIIGFEGWSPSEKVKDAIAIVERFANDKPQPVIFEFTNLELRYLEMENGMPIDLADIHDVGVSLRYTKSIDLDIAKAESLYPSHLLKANLKNKFDG